MNYGEDNFGNIITTPPNVGIPVNATQASQGYDLDKMINDLATRARNGDDAAFEKYFNYIATRKSEEDARTWTASREDNQYQRLMSDLKKAGISPYVLTGVTPGVSSSSGASYSSSQMTSQKTSERNLYGDVLGKILSLIGTSLMALAVLG